MTKEYSEPMQQNSEYCNLFALCLGPRPTKHTAKFFTSKEFSEKCQGVSFIYKTNNCKLFLCNQDLAMKRSQNISVSLEICNILFTELTG